MNKKRFKIALSFPGEYRSFVEDIVDNLTEYFLPEEILYDLFYQYEFSRGNLDTYLQDLYKNDSELIIVFYGFEYNVKPWCGLEYRSIRTFLNKPDNKDFVMFIKCDEGSPSGFFESIDGFIEAFRYEPEQIAHFIIARYLFNHGKKIGKNCRYKILVLDDDVALLKMFKHELDVAFSSCPYYPQIICANTVDEAIAMKEIYDMFDVCILDVALQEDLHMISQRFNSSEITLYNRLVEDGSDKESCKELDKKIQPKFYIRSQLDDEIVKGTFDNNCKITCLQKTKTSNESVAKMIRAYLDMQYRMMLHRLMQSVREPI